MLLIYVCLFIVIQQIFCVVDCDPIDFSIANKEMKCRKAMKAEIYSIEENKYWNLVDLPKGHNIIGLKRVYRTKLKESRNT